MVTITIEGLHVSIGRQSVLQGVNATLNQGEFVGIIGPNGAGKSTLVRTILGLLKADQGRVCVDDKDVARMKRADLARRISYLPQGQTMHWPLAVERLVALGRLPYLGPLSRLTPDDRLAIDRAMKLTDVTALRHRISTELSGGERVRALLARTLAVEAPVLIADEPLASLDPGHQLEVMNLLKDQAAGGSLVVTVLHDLTMAAQYCSRLIVLDQGRIVGDGAPGTILTPDLLAKVYGIDAWIAEAESATLVVPIRRH